MPGLVERVLQRILPERPLPVRKTARGICAFAGPWQIAADYGAAPDASLPEIAERFAEATGPQELQEAIAAGAREGFDEWLAAHPHDPYD